MLNMIQSQHYFKWRFFKYDPAIRAVKKSLKYKATDTYLIKHTVEKKILFLIKRRYVTYKTGFYVTYEDHNRQRQLKIEEWVQIEKGIYRPTNIAAAKNDIAEGESIQFTW